MKGLLGKFSGGADLRMFWGSFEDKGTNGVQLDMSLTATQNLYYDSGGEYAQLQQIKKYTTPTTSSIRPSPCSKQALLQESAKPTMVIAHRFIGGIRAT